MRQHLHNSVLRSRAPEAKRRTNITTQGPVNADEVNEGVFVLGNATLEVVAPLDFYLFIYSFIYLRLQGLWPWYEKCCLLFCLLLVPLLRV